MPDDFSRLYPKVDT